MHYFFKFETSFRNLGIKIFFQSGKRNYSNWKKNFKDAISCGTKYKETFTKCFSQSEKFHFVRYSFYVVKHFAKYMEVPFPK